MLLNGLKMQQSTASPWLVTIFIQGPPEAALSGGKFYKDDPARNRITSFVRPTRLWDKLISSHWRIGWSGMHLDARNVVQAFYPIGSKSLIWSSKVGFANVDAYIIYFLKVLISKTTCFLLRFTCWTLLALWWSNPLRYSIRTKWSFDPLNSHQSFSRFLFYSNSSKRDTSFG
jgi:hypothetical protein